MVKSIYKFLKKEERLKILFLFFLSLVENIIEILAIASVPVLYLIFQGKDAFLNFFEGKNIFFLKKILVNYNYQEIVNLFIFMFISIFIARFFIKVINKFKVSNFSANLTSTKINNVINTFFSLPFEFNQNYKISEFQLILESIETISRNIIALISIAKEIIILIFMLILIFYQSILIGLIVSFTSFFIIIIFKILQKKKLFKHGEFTRKFRLIFYDNIKEGIMGLQEILIYRKLDFLLDDFKKNNTKLFSYKFRSEFLLQLPLPIIEFIAALILVLIFIMMYIFSNDSFSSISTYMILLAVCLLRTVPAISAILSSLSNLTISKFLIYNTLKKIEDFNHVHKYQNFNNINNFTFYENIKLINCSYNYKNETKVVLDKINLEIKKGEKVAFVGNTGCGKTSLINLIVGLIEPSSGHVLYDDKKRSNEMLNPGLVPQNIHLFNNSIAANILLKNDYTSIDIDYLDQLIDVCQLGDFINSKKNGIEYVIEDNAKNLSGGEKQRIALARALFHNSDFLILDEATTGLDKKMERKVYENIVEFKPNLTLIMISHHLDNLFICDKIYSISNGTIVGRNI